MKLLLITTSFPDGNEGAAAAGMFVVDFARTLVEKGHKVSVVTPAKTQGHKNEHGIQVHRFSVPHLPLSLLKPTNPAHWQSIYYTLKKGHQAVDQACKEKKFDHILALWTLPCGEWARLVGRKYNISYSTWALGSDIWTLGKIPIIRQILKRVLRQATHRFADGFQLADDVKHISGLDCDFLPSARCLTFLNERSYNRKQPYRLAFLGRWHPNKGIDLLMLALEKLENECWEKIELVRIYGGGPLEEEVKKSGLKLKSLNRPIEIGGYLNQIEAQELLSWADYLIIPSRIESIPVIFSDAMQAGCPVIVTPVGDMSLLIKKYHCGFLTKTPDVNSISTTIALALKTPPETFSTGIKNAANDFKMENIVPALTNMFKNP